MVNGFGPNSVNRKSDCQFPYFLDLRFLIYLCFQLRVMVQGDKLESVFRQFLVEDRGVDGSASYVDFLCHLHREISKNLWENRNDCIYVWREITNCYSLWKASQHFFLLSVHYSEMALHSFSQVFQIQSRSRHFAKNKYRYRTNWLNHLWLMINVLDE